MYCTIDKRKAGLSIEPRSRDRQSMSADMSHLCLPEVIGYGSAALPEGFGDEEEGSTQIVERQDLGTPLRPCVRACQESGVWESGKTVWLPASYRGAKWFPRSSGTLLSIQRPGVTGVFSPISDESQYRFPVAIR